VTSLSPVLCTVSIILSTNTLAFVNKNELYSSLDSMSALYICNKLEKWLPHDLWARYFRIFILISESFQTLLKWGIHVFFESNSIPNIFLDFLIGIWILSIIMVMLPILFLLVKKIHRDFSTEKEKPETNV
jgi:hypothetical protein